MMKEIAIRALEGASKYEAESLADVIELAKLLGGYVTSETVERVRSRRLGVRPVEPKRLAYKQAD